MSLKFHFDVQLDLQGMTAEDAIHQLEQVVYSDSGQSIMVIHGIGGGILKNAVRQFARECVHVRNYALGESLNLPGGPGITIIYT